MPSDIMSGGICCLWEGKKREISSQCEYNLATAKGYFCDL